MNFFLKHSKIWILIFLFVPLNILSLHYITWRRDNLYVVITLENINIIYWHDTYTWVVCILLRDNIFGWKMPKLFQLFCPKNARQIGYVIASMLRLGTWILSTPPSLMREKASWIGRGGGNIDLRDEMRWDE